MKSKIIKTVIINLIRKKKYVAYFQVIKLVKKVISIIFRMNNTVHIFNITY